MKIAVISDSHYDASSIKLVKKYLSDVDVLIHCGDGAEDTKLLEKDFNGEIYAVRGNCDISNKYPNERILDFVGTKIFVTHGHMYNVKSEYNSIFYKGKELEADIVLFGHSHRAMVSDLENMTLMNPGSVTLPFGGAKKTMGFIELIEGKMPNIYLTELA